jgi:hypothetical protein
MTKRSRAILSQRVKNKPVVCLVLYRTGSCVVMQVDTLFLGGDSKKSLNTCKHTNMIEQVYASNIQETSMFEIWRSMSSLFRLTSTE